MNFGAQLQRKKSDAAAIMPALPQSPFFNNRYPFGTLIGRLGSVCHAVRPANCITAKINTPVASQVTARGLFFDFKDDFSQLPPGSKALLRIGGFLQRIPAVNHRL